MDELKFKKEELKNVFLHCDAEGVKLNESDFFTDRDDKIIPRATFFQKLRVAYKISVEKSEINERELLGEKFIECKVSGFRDRDGIRVYDTSTKMISLSAKKAEIERTALAKIKQGSLKKEWKDYYIKKEYQRFLSNLGGVIETGAKSRLTANLVGIQSLSADEMKFLEAEYEEVKRNMEESETESSQSAPRVFEMPQKESDIPQEPEPNLNLKNKAKTKKVTPEPEPEPKPKTNVESSGIEFPDENDSDDVKREKLKKILELPCFTEVERNRMTETLDRSSGKWISASEKWIRNRLEENGIK